MNEPIPVKEMKKILEEQFKVIWGAAFGIVEEGDLYMGNIKITKDNKQEVEKLKKLLAEMEQEVIAYRDDCISNFNESMMAIYEDDLDAFKTEVFANKLWTVRSALHDMSNPELERYRDSFDNATASEVYEHVNAILVATRDYVKNVFPKISIKSIQKIEDLKLDFLNEDDLLMSGVIGLGIRSELLHRLYPGIFPIMTRRTLWGMFFLTDQEEFVVDENRDGRSRTSHQWNYEYDRLCFYNNYLMNIMEKYLEKHKIKIKQELRFGYINVMLVKYAEKYKKEIEKLYSWKYSGL